MKVSIFGLGYVGCVTAACLTKDGHEIIGVDVLPGKAEKLASGKPTVIETGLEEMIAEAHGQGRITATTNGREAVLASDASIICVGTPTGSDGTMDLTALRQTAELIGQAMAEKMDRHVVIMRSTVPAGTAETVVFPRLHPGSPPSHLYQDSDLVVVPEFLREGTAIADYYDPPFVLVGSATGQPDENREVIEGLFGAITGHVTWVPFREAEMLKAVCNAFHALKVAFGNEVGALCSSLSIDGQSLMAQFVQDQKLNISPAYLRPGLPFGGSCLPKDLRMLVQLGSRAGLDLPLLRGTLAANEAHLRRAIDSVPKNGHRRIGLNGLAFKSGTDDLRESPIVLIAEYFIGKGYDVKIHDPAIETSMITGTNRDYIERHIPHLSSRIVHSLDELIEHSEVLLVTRDGDHVLDRIVALERRPAVVDLRGQNHLVKRLLEAKKRAKPAPKAKLAGSPAKSRSPLGKLKSEVSEVLVAEKAAAEPVVAQRD
jgi:GDP-mannose 6-dehydrogenase